MTENPYEWLRQKGDLVATSGTFTPDKDDLETLFWLAPRCSFDDTAVRKAVKDSAGVCQLILEMRDRVRAEGKRLTQALADLYRLTESEERQMATQIVREISESGLIELHREEAQNILRGIAGGYIKPAS